LNKFVMQVMRMHYFVVRMLAGLAGICVVFLILGIGAEAIMRSFGIGLVKGIIDLSEYSLFLIAILAAPWLVNINEHIRVDLLVGQLRGAWKTRMDRLASAVILVISAVILYYSTDVFIESLLRGEPIYRELVFPEWWVQWQIPVAMLLIFIESVQRTFFPQAAYRRAAAGQAIAQEASQLRTVSSS